MWLMTHVVEVLCLGSVAMRKASIARHGIFCHAHAETHLPECYASRDGKSQAASAQQRQSVRILRISLFLVRRISFVSCRRRGVLTSSRTEEIAWQKRVSCDHDFARKSPAHS